MKNVFLKIIVGALCLCGLLGIIYILIGKFDVIAFRLFSTLASIILYSIAGLVCAKLYDTNRYKFVALFGMFMIAIGIIFTNFNIWEILPSNDILNKVYSTIYMLNATIFWISLTLSANPNKEVINFIQIGLSLTMTALFLMLLLDVWFDTYDFPEIYTRLQWMLVLLSVLGTVLIPILNNIYAKKQAIYEQTEIN